MSSIDDRIVDMQFNNASFEKNVGTSIKSLEHLNKALELQGASKGLDSVMVAVKAIDLSQIASGIENISSKFNALGAIGLSVINKLVGALMGFAGTSINAIMDPLIEGGKRRAQNIEQAKFMIKGLGKSWEKLYKDMDYAVSGTAFGIDQAAKAASQLSASGISAGDNMKKYLRGISGVAAMTGSSYDEIANIFTKVAGGGRVMAQELNQVSDRGLNAAKTLADYYNKVHKGAKVTEKDIRKMASEGKISADMFAKAMDRAYGAQATKANELYSGSLSNVRAALSRIGEAFVTPVFEKQRNIFNQLRLVINGVAKALGPFITLWGEVQKASGDTWVGVLKDMEKAIGFLSNSPNTAYNKQIEAYKKYLKNVEKAESKGKKKPKKTDDIKAGEKLFKAREKLIDAEAAAEKKLDKAKQKYKEKDSKRNKKALDEAKKNLEAAKKATATSQEQTDFTRSIAAVTNGLRVLWKTSQRVFGAIKEAWNEAFPKNSGAQSLLLTLANAFQKFAYWLQPSNKQLETFKKILVGLFTVFRVALTIISNAFKAIPALFQIIVGVFKLLLAVFRPVIDFVSQLASSFLSMFKGAGEGVDVVKTIGDALTWLRTDGVGKLLDMLSNATKVVTDFWNSFGDGSGGNLFEGFDPFSGMLEKLKNFGSIMSNFFQNAWNWAKGIYQSIKDAMGQFGSGAGGFFKGLSAAIKFIGSSIAQIFRELKGGLSEFLKGFDWSTLLAGLSSGAFLAIVVKAVKFIRNLGKSFGTFSDLAKGVLKASTGALDGFTKTMVNMQRELKTKMIVNIAIAVGILAGAFWVLSKVDIKGADVAAQAMTLILLEVLGALYVMSKIQSDKGTVKMAGLAFALGLLAVAMLGFAKALTMVAGIKADRLLPSTLALLAAMTVMAAVLVRMGDKSAQLVAAAFAMDLLAGAMIGIAGAIALLGVMPLDMLVQGGIALAGILALMTLFAAFPSENALKAGVAMDAMAVAILLMTGAIAILGVMPFEVIKQGGLTLLGMMAALVIAANLMRTAVTGAGAMIAMALAIAILIIPIKAFGEMDSAKLEQGVVAVLILAAGLVLAASLVQKAAAGAGAFILLAVAVAILSGAIWVLAKLPADQVWTAVGVIAAALAILLAAAAVASTGPVTAGLLILAGAILAMGAAVALAGVGIVMFSAGLATIGIAAQAAIPGLMAFAQAATDMSPHLLAMVGLAAALGALALAVGALGLAFIALGVGLIAVGTGMALLAAFGGIGAIAVLAVWKALEPLIWESLKIAGLGGAFLALGAGLIALGGGLALTAVGLVAVSLGLLAIVGSGFATAAAIDSLRMSLERFAPLIPQLQSMSSGLTQFGGSVSSMNSSLQGVSYGLVNAQTGFISFGVGVKTLLTNLAMIPSAVSRVNVLTQSQLHLLVFVFITTAQGLGVAVRQLGTEVQNGSVSFGQSLAKMVSDVGLFANGINSAVPKATSAIAFMITSIASYFKNQLSRLGVTVRAQGESVGKNVGAGIVKGVDGSQGSVYAAAKRLADRLVKGIKDTLEIKSPSKVMERLGEYVKQGFFKGLTGFEDEPLHRVMEAVNTMRDELKQAIDESKADAKDLNSKISKLNKKKKKTSKDKKALKDAKKELSDVKAVQKKSEAALAQLDGALQKQRDELMRVSDQYDFVVDELKKATTDLTNAETALTDAQKKYTEQFSKLPDFADEGDLVNTYIDDLAKQITATKKFAEDLAYIRKLGLDDKMYEKLLEKGIEAQPFIDALIESGQAGIDEINKLHSELDDVASSLGSTVAKEMYQNGVDVARGIVLGLQSQEAELKAEMEKLANTMVDTIKKQLGIKSPSRVLAGIGGYSMIGLMEGLQKYIPALERTSEDIGDTTIDGLRKAIDEIGEGVYADMDITPVIRPVLDLTDVQNSARGLNDLFMSRSIDVGSIYADAAGIALAAREREYLSGRQRDEVRDASDSVTFIQNNNSPKAISNIELYRQTRNQLSEIKKGLPK